MSSFFKSESGKKEVLDLYDQKLEELNIAYDSREVETTFGKTHILVIGDPMNPPLILVHGSNGCAPIALECYPNLSSKYQVFAVDVIAQPNKSEGIRPSMKNDTYGRWMNEIMDALALRDVVLAGFSFGGLIILKTLIHDASRVKEAFLASPAYLMNGNPIKALLNIFIPMRRYMKTQELKHIEKFLAVLFTERDEFAVKFLSKVFLHFEMDFTPVPVLSKKEASAIHTPITLIAAKNDVLFPGEKMIKRAKKLLPTIKHTLLLESSKHVQDSAGNKIVEQLMLEVTQPEFEK